MILQAKADHLGILAGSLCFIHCLATPFLFLAKACATSCCAEAPLWWQFFDYFFILISCIAIYFTTKNTSKPWMRIALWSAWALLLMAILNETFEISIQSKLFVYIPSFAIIGLHFYNRRYCNCAGTSCCTH